MPGTDDGFFAELKNIIRRTKGVSSSELSCNRIAASDTYTFLYIIIQPACSEFYPKPSIIALL